MKLCRITVILALSLGPTLPARAWGQTADQATTDVARSRFREGVAFYDKGDYESARASFLQAYALKKHPALLINLGWSSLKGGHALEGARYFKQFLAEGHDVTDKQRADVEDGLKQAKRKLGQIEVVAVAGSEIFVDGQLVAMAPLTEPLLVELGVHEVRVRRPDSAPEAQSVTTVADERLTARFSPPAPPPAPPPEPAPPTPAPQATAQPEAQPPPPPSAAPTEATTESPSKELPNLPIPETPRSEMPLWPSYLGYGLMAPAVAASLYVGLKSVSDAQTNANVTRTNIMNAHGSCPASDPRFAGSCASYQDDLNLVSTDKAIAYTFGGVGGALFVFSTIYMTAAFSHNTRPEHVQPLPSPPATSLTLVPMLSRGSVGLRLEATF